MLTLLAPEIAHYVERHTEAEPALLQELRAQTQASLNDAQMQVGPVEGALLRLLVALSRATRILEIGTFSGYSALAMAQALPASGRLLTCDIDPIALGVARAFFARSGYADRIEVREGPALQTLADLGRDGQRFDLAFIDADKANYVAYYEAILPMLEPGGLVIADNTLWSGRVLAPESESDRGIVRFNEHVHNDPRVEQVMLAVRDGVTLARKR